MLSSQIKYNYKVVNPRPEHFGQIQELCRKVYPFSKPWSLEQLESHRSYFPDGQLIVLDVDTGQVVGLAFSLIIAWDDYSSQDNWQDFTSGGFFHNHNPKKGKTLYGAEIMVDPELRGRGIGKMLYKGRQKIVEKYQLKRIRAGARLRGYSKFKEKFSPDEYVKEVIEKRIFDPTLSFQLNQGFQVIDVAPNYLFNDPESLGYAAVIEWLNPKVATPKDLEKQKQSVATVLAGEKFAPEFLPRELRRLVRKATLTLGLVIKEHEGDRFFRKIEFYREQLKKTRNVKNKPQLEYLLRALKKESPSDRLKLAHAFSLQLELVNVCEAAYRTWRQRQKPIAHGVKSKLDLTYVLTSHPTEARSKTNVEILNKLQRMLVDGILGNFAFDDADLITQLRMMWLQPLSKTQTPTVVDEAEYIFSLVLSHELLDFILGEKPSYNINLRTWVGGDKDGHPGVNREVMKDCLNRSRAYILKVLDRKMKVVLTDLLQLETIHKIRKTEVEGLRALIKDLKKIELVTAGDGTRIKAWCMKFNSYLKASGSFVNSHHQVLLLKRALKIFPAFVFPLELREDSQLITAALTDKSSAIRGMLSELSKVSGALSITSYATGLIISNCESAQGLTDGCELVNLATRARALPVIPLFESRHALSSSKSILKEWFKEKRHHDWVHRHWHGKFEIMLGYSDSAKQSGVLQSRYLIAQAMNDIENRLQDYGITPVFFHGSGGSVDRGGGSLKEQIAWWPNTALENPKLTIQGEMIQRTFATKEILNSQCIHMANEFFRRKVVKIKMNQSRELEHFVNQVGAEYSKLVNNGQLLKQLLDATPYKYLDILKIGSRPSKRPSKEVSVSSLRAIPWVLCWTQSRVLLPTWWGVGTAWKNTPEQDKKKLTELFSTSPFFSSFVKALGFTLAKVELDIWELYFKEQDAALFKKFRTEYQNASKFVLEVSKEKRLIWYRPWLEESIKLRASHIHILNLLQIHAINDGDEALLKETLVGIACGMLTTG